MSYFKKSLVLLCGIFTGSVLYVSSALAGVCFLPDMSGDDCGNSVPKVASAKGTSCPANYKKVGDDCVYDCRGYPYNAETAHDMEQNKHFECEKCPGDNYYKCECAQGYRKKLLSNECVNACEGYDIASSDVENYKSKGFTCEACRDNSSLSKCECKGELTEDGYCHSKCKNGEALSQSELEEKTSKAFKCTEVAAGSGCYDCKCVNGLIEATDGECQAPNCSGALKNSLTDNCHTCTPCDEVDGKTYYECKTEEKNGYKLVDGVCQAPDTEYCQGLPGGIPVKETAGYLWEHEYLYGTNSYFITALLDGQEYSAKDVEPGYDLGFYELNNQDDSQCFALNEFDPHTNIWYDWSKNQYAENDDYETNKLCLTPVTLPGNMENLERYGCPIMKCGKGGVAKGWDNSTDRQSNSNKCTWINLAYSLFTEANYDENGNFIGMQSGARCLDKYTDTGLSGLSYFVGDEKIKKLLNLSGTTYTMYSNDEAIRLYADGIIDKGDRGVYKVNTASSFGSEQDDTSPIYSLFKKAVHKYREDYLPRCLNNDIDVFDMKRRENGEGSPLGDGYSNSYKDADYKGVYTTAKSYAHLGGFISEDWYDESFNKMSHSDIGEFFGRDLAWYNTCLGAAPTRYYCSTGARVEERSFTTFDTPKCAFEKIAPPEEEQTYSSDLGNYCSTYKCEAKYQLCSNGFDAYKKVIDEKIEPEIMGNTVTFKYVVSSNNEKDTKAYVDKVRTCEVRDYNDLQKYYAQDGAYMHYYKDKGVVPVPDVDELAYMLTYKCMADSLAPTYQNLRNNISGKGDETWETEVEPRLLENCAEEKLKSLVDKYGYIEDFRLFFPTEVWACGKRDNQGCCLACYQGFYDQYVELKKKGSYSRKDVRDIMKNAHETCGYRAERDEFMNYEDFECKSLDFGNDPYFANEIKLAQEMTGSDCYDADKLAQRIEEKILGGRTYTEANPDYFFEKKDSIMWFKPEVLFPSELEYCKKIQETDWSAGYDCRKCYENQAKSFFVGRSTPWYEIRNNIKAAREKCGYDIRMPGEDANPNTDLDMLYIAR